MINGTHTKPNQFRKMPDKTVRTPKIHPPANPQTMSKQAQIGAIINIPYVIAKIANSIQPIQGHNVSIDKGKKHIRNKDAVVKSITGKPIIAHVKNMQLNSKNGIENGNSGIDIIETIMNTNMPYTARIIAIKIYHNAKMITAIWSIHVPKHGIIAQTAEAMPKMSKIR